MPDGAGHGSEDDHRPGGYKPGHDAEDRANRSVELAIRDDRSREVEPREDAETGKEYPCRDRRRQERAPRSAAFQQEMNRPPEEHGHDDEGDDGNEHKPGRQVANWPDDGGFERDREAQRDDPDRQPKQATPASMAQVEGLLVDLPQ